MQVLHFPTADGVEPAEVFSLDRPLTAKVMPLATLWVSGAGPAALLWRFRQLRALFWRGGSSSRS